MHLLRGHKLHQFYLYQISHLPVKEKTAVELCNYACLFGKIVQKCGTCLLVFLCSYAHYRRTTGHELCQSFLPTNSLRYAIPPSIEAKGRHTISEINLPNSDNIRLMFS